MIRSLVSVFAFASLALDAQAASYTAQPGSTLKFTAGYQGEPFTGRFGKFDATIAFDPKDLAATKFDVRIPLSSASTDNEERDEALQSEDFFGSAKQPVARYQATRVVALKDGRFRAEGTLTLHGKSKAVPLVFAWTPGATPKLVGEAQVNRLDFDVGTGDWTDLELIPNAVKVTTSLVLAPVAPK